MQLTKKEIDFLNKHEVCSLATLQENYPHVVGVCYIFVDGFFYIVTNYGTKKYKNILKNKNVALTVYEYKPSKGIMIQGKTEILEKGEEFRKITDMFLKKFAWARADPWKEGESAILKISPIKKASWSL